MRSAVSTAQGTGPSAELTLGEALLLLGSTCLLLKGALVTQTVEVDGGGLGPCYFRHFLGTKATRLWR